MQLSRVNCLLDKTNRPVAKCRDESVGVMTHQPFQRLLRVRLPVRGLSPRYGFFVGNLHEHDRVGRAVREIVWEFQDLPFVMWPEHEAFPGRAKISRRSFFAFLNWRNV